MTLFYAGTQNFVSTTLNGTITDSASTITVNDASKLQFPGYAVIDREDGNGTATPSAREVIYFTGISGNDLTGCTRGADGSTARSHQSGALVEAVPTVGAFNSLVTAVAASLNEAGTGLHVSSATITGIEHAARFVGTSIASISRVESPFYQGTQMQLTSIASVSRVMGISMGISSVASVAVGHFSTHLNASGASITGFSAIGGFNALFQVPGSLASQANIGGMIVVPTAVTASHMVAYVQTPASIASVAGYIVKQGGTVVGMFTILGGGTYASSASLAVTALAAGDNLTFDIRSTASLAADLSVVLRAS